MIVELSWLLGHSVNSYISDDNASVNYISIDTVVQRDTLHGLGCLIAKLDLEDTNILWLGPKTGTCQEQ